MQSSVFLGVGLVWQPYTGLPVSFCLATSSIYVGSEQLRLLAAGPEPLMSLMPQKDLMCANLLLILASIHGIWRGLSQSIKARFILVESIGVSRTCCGLSPPLRGY